MKKKLSIFLAAFMMMAAANAQKATLKGVMTGFGQDTKMVLNRVVNNRLVPVDTVDINAKGKYRTQVEVAQPTLFVITFTRVRSPQLHAMLSAEDVVTFDAEYVQTQNAAKVTAVKGSRDMELYMKFNNALMQPEPMEQAVRVLEENADCLMAAFLVTIFDQQFEQFSALYKKVRDGLIKTYPNDPAVQYIDSRLRSTLIGEVAPEIAMKDASGNIRRLSDLRGKVVMIDFWASWCRPCRAENPNVASLYKKYHDKGFEIYSVSMDKDRNQWLQAIKADGLVWENHVSDLNGWTSTGGSTYGISSIPATVLIDKDGIVIARNLRGEELAKKLAEIFGE